MLERRELFPHVIEINHQARRRFGCSVYLVYSGSQWCLIDIGYEDTADEIIEMIRQMDFPLAGCKFLIATHADVDHIQGFGEAHNLLPEAKIAGHPDAAELLKQGDRLMTYAEISAQGISIDLPKIIINEIVSEGDKLTIGDIELEVWHTPGHTNGQLSFRMGNLLFSGDNLFKDGCVGNIDAHHGSNIPDFIESLKRVRDSDVEWLLPSHGPVFRKDAAMIQKTIDRLEGYLHMADFGTCAIDWPLLDDWEKDLVDGVNPTDD